MDQPISVRIHTLSCSQHESGLPRTPTQKCMLQCSSIEESLDICRRRSERPANLPPDAGCSTSEVLLGRDAAMMKKFLRSVVNNILRSRQFIFDTTKPGRCGP